MSTTLWLHPHVVLISTSVYHIVLIFRGSLISQIWRTWNRSRNLFNENLSHCAVTPMGNTNSRNLFNEFLQISNSRKFRPAKYKRYTIFPVYLLEPWVNLYVFPPISVKVIHCQCWEEQLEELYYCWCWYWCVDLGLG